MIIEYNRPMTLEDASALLSRSTPKTIPLGGGTVINRPSKEPFSVVDLQALGLDKIDKRGKNLVIGATTTLQALASSEHVHSYLVKVIYHETSYNLRQVATVAGTLMASTGRSPFTTAMLSLDVQLSLFPERQFLRLGDFLVKKGFEEENILITKITMPMDVRLAYHYVARTIADQPIVCVAVTRWESGRTRVTIGGYGNCPTLAFDGPDSNGADIASQSAYSHASDKWASSEYRKEMALILTRRCLDEVSVLE